MKTTLIAMAEPVLATGLQRILENACIDASICTDTGLLYERLVISPPELLILDHGLIPGLAFLADLRNSAPACQIIVTGKYIPQLTKEEIVQLGVREIVEGNATAGEWLRATMSVISAPVSRLNALANRIENCEPSEKDVLKLIAHGLTDREIGTLIRRPHTSVRNNVRRMIGRFGFRRRSELALYALMIHTS